MLLRRFHCVAAKATIIRKSYRAPVAWVQHHIPVRPSQHAPGQLHHTQRAAKKNHFETKEQSEDRLWTYWTPFEPPGCQIKDQSGTRLIISKLECGIQTIVK